jgi:hypothetical protein
MSDHPLPHDDEALRLRVRALLLYLAEGAVAGNMLTVRRDGLRDRIGDVEDELLIASREAERYRREMLAWATDAR